MLLLLREGRGRTGYPRGWAVGVNNAPGCNETRLFFAVTTKSEARRLTYDST